MMAEDFDATPAEQLVTNYIDLSQNEDDAMLRNQIVGAKKLTLNRMKIEGVLRSRGSQARRALLPLLKHPNAQVRLNAAKRLLAVALAEGGNT